MKLPYQLEDLVAVVESDGQAEDPIDALARSVIMAENLQVLADQLIGHFVDRARDAAATWTEIGTALGVTKQAAQKRFVTRRVPGDSQGLFARFTDDARAVVVKAMETARERGDSEIGTAHIVLALIEDPTAWPGRALATQGVTSEEVREAIERTLGRGNRPVPEHIPWAADAKKTLELSLREAFRTKAALIGPEHVLLGILRDQKSAASMCLASLGIDRRAVAELLVE